MDIGEYSEKRQEGLAPSEAGVVAAGGVLEVIVEDARLAVSKGDFYKGGPPQHEGVLLFHHHPISPFWISAVNDPIPNFQIQGTPLFHGHFISNFGELGKAKRFGENSRNS